MRTPAAICVWSLSAMCAVKAEASGVAVQRSFSTPEQAVTALFTAIHGNDRDAFLRVAGLRMAPFWGGADTERDTFERETLMQSARQGGVQLHETLPDRRLIRVGRSGEPFPAPLVKTAAGWQFDDETGAQTLRTRQIERNETAAMEMCRRFVEAELEYYSGVHAYAGKIRSAPGKHDGLFWIGADESAESPMGPPFAAAAYAEGANADGTRPLFGYFFKILPRGSHGGPGFALLAWPAEYGTAGVHSYLVDQGGAIYRKDLGTATFSIAENMARFRVDRGWTRMPARP